MTENQWTQDNIETLIEWLTISAITMKIIEEAIIQYRKLIRKNIILGLILSSSAGTISASRINTVSSHYWTVFFEILFTAMSFAITYSTGYIKVFHIQEKLENFIKIKQKWISFSSAILSEFQLPIALRENAINIIKKYKNTYLDLIKYDLDIPTHIRGKVETDMNLTIKTSLSDIIIEVGIEECTKLGIINEEIVRYKQESIYEQILKIISCKNNDDVVETNTSKDHIYKTISTKSNSQNNLNDIEIGIINQKTTSSDNNPSGIIESLEILQNPNQNTKPVNDPKEVDKNFNYKEVDITTLSFSDNDLNKFI